jgi:hypothetical protein
VDHFGRAVDEAIGVQEIEHLGTLLIEQRARMNDGRWRRLDRRRQRGGGAEPGSVERGTWNHEGLTGRLHAHIRGHLADCRHEVPSVLSEGSSATPRICETFFGRQ